MFIILPRSGIMRGHNMRLCSFTRLPSGSQSGRFTAISIWSANIPQVYRRRYCIFSLILFRIICVWFAAAQPRHLLGPAGLPGGTGALAGSDTPDRATDRIIGQATVRAGAAQRTVHGGRSAGSQHRTAQRRSRQPPAPGVGRTRFGTGSQSSRALNLSICITAFAAAPGLPRERVYGHRAVGRRRSGRRRRTGSAQVGNSARQRPDNGSQRSAPARTTPHRLSIWPAGAGGTRSTAGLAGCAPPSQLRHAQFCSGRNASLSSIPSNPDAAQ